MNKYFEYYSKHGLNQMINDNKNDIEKLKENYKAVEQGLLYNPLCKDENMKEIKRMKYGFIIMIGMIQKQILKQ
jgi:hypothetical protein